MRIMMLSSMRMVMTNLQPSKPHNDKSMSSLPGAILPVLSRNLPIALLLVPSEAFFNPTTYRTIPSNTKQTPTESIQQQYQHKSNPTIYPHDCHDDNKNTNKCKPCFPNFLPLT